MLEKEKDNKIITVLGKTFSTEEERRAYFREELRNKLPELKQMEGFPIGEDEDILNLSDPPHYTACPNPWLNDFISEWEEEKKQLLSEGIRSSAFEVKDPYASDVSEGKRNPIYNVHTYPTKVPHPAIMKFILHYTQPGDIVYDGFAGTGMTGLGAQVCDSSNLEFNHKIKLEIPDAKLGVRKAILNDLSPIANFISYNFNKEDKINEVLEKAEKVISKLLKELSWVYETNHGNGNGKGLVNYTVWSDVFGCKSCSSEIVFWDALIDHKSLVMNDEFCCSQCGVSHTKRELTQLLETKKDLVTDRVKKSPKRVPVLIHYKVGTKTFLKTPDKEDLALIDQLDKQEIKNWVPHFKLHKGDKTGEPTRKAIEKSYEFFNKRSLYVLSKLRSEIDNDLLFLLTSMLNRSSLLVKTQVSNYLSQLKGKTVGGWAGTPLDGTLYIPSLSSEVSILSSLKTRLSAIRTMMIYKSDFTSNKNFGIQTGSALSNGIKNNSIDYIFTDPPFGSNRMYSDLNFLNESWIKVLTNQNQEAIESRAQNKSLYDYQTLMKLSFLENYRVLKPGKWMTVEFSNTSAAVWNSIQSSLQQSGFIIANVSALDKKIGSFNAVNNATSVKQDLVISCYKPSSEFDDKFKRNQNTSIAVWDFVEEHLHHLPIHLAKENATAAIIERSPKILFDRLIAFYVQKGLPVPLDAGKFQQGLKERFIERDGMYFTNEQVQEYDKKKAENPEFIQLSILVSSEQDGVLWLKNLLSIKPMKYQDVNPEWMQAIAGVRKGDILPELATILEENFLIDQEDKWYAPDPENEADLDKLRTKRLLKQFDTYKTEAAKPKAKKIKEVRVESLRAGFKQCYQDKDFQSIVSVGDKIPNNLLMEDEVLLQFYDIASTRV